MSLKTRPLTGTASKNINAHPHTLRHTALHQCNQKPAKPGMPAGSEVRARPLNAKDTPTLINLVQSFRYICVCVCIYIYAPLHCELVRAQTPADALPELVTPVRHLNVSQIVKHSGSSYSAYHCRAQATTRGEANSEVLTELTDLRSAS